jgi:oligo-alginate lyase
MRLLFLPVAWAVFLPALVHAQPPRTASVFFPPPLVERVRVSSQSSDWGKQLRQRVIELADQWRDRSDDELWSMMFASTLPRSWMVWSNGHCPACKADVPMYTWHIDALAMPWKVQCPHCRQQFPTNDFARFHDSGLDQHGTFDPSRADRSLLFNAEHPDPDHPLHKFGVDDGTGYVDGENRWRFIGAYLIYGQWKQLIVGGIKSLAAAYLMTGDEVYAHKAAILLDRVADLYPAFDYLEQGVVYEVRQPTGNGYVSIWHDANLETRELAVALDAIRPGIAEDAELVAFLSQKSTRHQTPVAKTTLQDILTNMERGLLHDPLANPHKIHSNYPQQELTTITIHTVLGWPDNRGQVLDMLDPVIARATAFDGTTGEKGLANYTSFAANQMAIFLGQYARVDPEFLKELHQRQPRLTQMWRFFIDTLCLGRYYPLSGDSGYFAGPIDRYVGVYALERHGMDATQTHVQHLLAPSMYSFIWQLYELSGDPPFVQLLHHMNGGTLEGLPHDLARDDAAEIQRRAQQVLDEHGTDLAIGSVNMQEWCLAILRSGKGEHARALWLDYDSGGGHGHFDGMNLGLFACGLDLMPDNGYPPVQFGGWNTPKAQWYLRSAAHNTVVVDGKDSAAGSGKTTLWVVEDGFAAITASAPNLIGGEQFDRTAMLIDISDEDFYVVDVFRVAGGSDHARFFQTHFGTVSLEDGISPKENPQYSFGPQTRGFRIDDNPFSGWHGDFEIEDRYKLLPPERRVRLRFTDLTRGAAAGVFESWIVPGLFNSSEELWHPRLIGRRSGEAPLRSTFVSVIEPYEQERALRRITRTVYVRSDQWTASQDNAHVRLVVQLADGHTDTIVSSVAGHIHFIRKDAGGTVVREVKAQPHQ